MDHLQAANTLAAERYLLNEMTELERDTFEAHYFSCAECAEDMRMAALIREGVAADFAGTPAGRHAAARPSGAQVLRPRFGWHRSVVLPWAVAATLAVVVGYETFLVAPARRSPLEAQALAPVTLRPASRGREPIVPLGASDRAVALAIDVDAPGASSALTYDLRSIDGRSIASGRLPAPPAGTPLFLLVPAWTLTPTTHYILSIRDAANASTTVAEYRFATAAP
jgi:hypothetical protein